MTDFSKSQFPSLHWKNLVCLHVSYFPTPAAMAFKCLVMFSESCALCLQWYWTCICTVRREKVLNWSCHMLTGWFVIEFIDSKYAGPFVFSLILNYYESMTLNALYEIKDCIRWLRNSCCLSGLSPCLPFWRTRLWIKPWPKVYYILSYFRTDYLWKSWVVLTWKQWKSKSSTWKRKKITDTVVLQCVCAHLQPPVLQILGLCQRVLVQYSTWPGFLMVESGHPGWKGLPSPRPQCYKLSVFMSRPPTFGFILNFSALLWGPLILKGNVHENFSRYHAQWLAHDSAKDWLNCTELGLLPSSESQPLPGQSIDWGCSRQESLEMVLFLEMLPYVLFHIHSFHIQT